MSSYTIILFTNILMYVVLTLSWTIFSGPTGYISLASAAFFGAGVYASALLSSSLPLPVVAVIGGPDRLPGARAYQEEVKSSAKND